MTQEMDLILWRHADAEDGAPDSARELTKRGHKQAERVAAWLKPRLSERCEILVSPAKRAQQTAAALDLPFTTSRGVGTGASVADILAAAGWPDRRDAVLVIGHQPTLGRVAALLLAGREADWSVKKGAIWWIGSRVRDGQAQAVLRAALSPELI